MHALKSKSKAKSGHTDNTCHSMHTCS
jgi:hypothetical protein